MDPEILSLLNTGAATLVAAAATDAWQQARKGFARLLGRGDQGRERATERRLDALAAAVQQASPEGRAEVCRQLQAAWQVRLGDLIEDDPNIAPSLQDLIERVRTELPIRQQAWVQNVTASGQGSAYGVMGHGGSIHIHPGPITQPQE